jgi:two-component system LytT family response regulator
VEEKIRVLMVDDDLVARKTLRALIGLHACLSLTAEAETVAEAREKIKETCPEVLFLDIHMPGGDGFELLKDLPTPPKVVFVTSSLGHSLEAFEFEAVDYLVKPVAPARFCATVQRLESALRRGGAHPVPHEKKDRICFRVDRQSHVIPVKNLIALRAQGNFTQVHHEDGKPLLVCRALGEYDKVLTATVFTRVDRSLIVNHDRVVRFNRQSRDRAELLLRGLDQPLELGRAATEKLSEMIK